MKINIYIIIFFSIIVADDVHIWISAVHDNGIELSLKSDYDIYGFDFELMNPLRLIILRKLFLMVQIQPLFIQLIQGME